MYIAVKSAFFNQIKEEGNLIINGEVKTITGLLVNFELIQSTSTNWFSLTSRMMSGMVEAALMVEQRVLEINEELDIKIMSSRLELFKVNLSDNENEVTSRIIRNNLLPSQIKVTLKK